MKLNPKTQTIRDHISDNILKEFLSQLPWQKDQLIGMEKTYKDVVTIDDIIDATIKVGRHDTMSGKFFVDMLQQLPSFELDKKHYRLWYNTFTKQAIPPRKYTNKFPGFHVRKIISQVKEAV